MGYELPDMMKPMFIKATKITYGKDGETMFINLYLEDYFIDTLSEVRIKKD